MSLWLGACARRLWAIPMGRFASIEFLGDSEHRTAISDDALLQMAILLYQQQRFDEAIAALEQQRERFPGSELAAHAAYWLGLSQTVGGAISAKRPTRFRAAAKRFPDHELAAAMVFAAGEAYRQMQDLAAAERYYQHVLTQYPDSTWADDSLQTLVQLAWEAGRQRQRSRELADRFAEQYPTSPLLAAGPADGGPRLFEAGPSTTRPSRCSSRCLAAADATRHETRSTRHAQPHEVAAALGDAAQPARQPADHRCHTLLSGAGIAGHQAASTRHSSSWNRWPTCRSRANW